MLTNFKKEIILFFGLIKKWSGIAQNQRKKYFMTSKLGYLGRGI